MKLNKLSFQSNFQESGLQKITLLLETLSALWNDRQYKIIKIVFVGQPYPFCGSERSISSSILKIDKKITKNNCFSVLNPYRFEFPIASRSIHYAHLPSLRTHAK